MRHEYHCNSHTLTLTPIAFHLCEVCVDGISFGNLHPNSKKFFIIEAFSGFSVKSISDYICYYTNSLPVLQE